MFGHKMNEFKDYTQTNKTLQKVELKDWEQHQDEIISLVFPQIALRARKVQKHYAQKLEKMRRNVLIRDLPPGTQVMILDEKYLKSPKPNTEPKYIGKYTIVRREVNGPYVIRDSQGDEYHRKVPIDQMKVLFKPGSLPAMKDDEDVWIVEKLIDDELRQNHRWYQVKWKGFTDPTWEPTENILDQNLIDKYWRRKTGMKVVESKKGSAHVRCIYSMTKQREYLFNVADQTAQTQDEIMKQRFLERCAEMEEQD